ncbi:MAG TPA: hypothetical protein VIV12_12335, partial [Streptosporangiaceae bacterium]
CGVPVTVAQEAVRIVESVQWCSAGVLARELRIETAASRSLLEALESDGHLMRYPRMLPSGYDGAWLPEEETSEEPLILWHLRHPEGKALAKARIGPGASLCRRKSPCRFRGPRPRGQQRPLRGRTRSSASHSTGGRERHRCNGASAGTFLVNGMWQGTWQIRDQSMRIQPFIKLRRADGDALLTEAAQLCAFVAPQARYDIVLENRSFLAGFAVRGAYDASHLRVPPWKPVVARSHSCGSPPGRSRG